MKRFLEIALVLLVIAVAAFLLRSKPQAGDWREDALAILRPLCAPSQVDLKLDHRETTHELRRHRKGPAPPDSAFGGLDRANAGLRGRCRRTGPPGRGGLG